MSLALKQPQFIAHQDPLSSEFDDALDVEFRLTRRERLRFWFEREVSIWRAELSDWSVQRAWLRSVGLSIKQTWDAIARGTYHAWTLLAAAFIARVTREDIEILRNEAHVAQRTPTGTYAIVVGAAMTVWILAHISGWGYPLWAIAFLLLQTGRVLLYLGSPMQRTQSRPAEPGDEQKRQAQVEKDAGWE